MFKRSLLVLPSVIFLLNDLNAQTVDAFKQDFTQPRIIPGYKLVWHDEFNNDGKPDTANWIYERGFVRNEELQWYKEESAFCKNGVLTIEGRKEEIKNPNYDPASNDWRQKRKFAEYTSASIQTKGHRQWLFGRFEIRARIDTTKGAWPAIWTLGTEREWPSNGEVDLMEFYRVNDEPTILANVAWGTEKRYAAKWHTEKIPLIHFTKNDPAWVKEFHVWRMDWDKEFIKLYLDDELLNTTPLSQTINAGGSNPFLTPQFLLLNLALGGNGSPPEAATGKIKFEVEYVRVYQKAGSEK